MSEEVGHGGKRASEIWGSKTNKKKTRHASLTGEKKCAQQRSTRAVEEKERKMELRRDENEVYATRRAASISAGLDKKGKITNLSKMTTHEAFVVNARCMVAQM